VVFGTDAFRNGTSRLAEPRADLGAVERRIRCLVADTLGTGEDDLTASVSLLDDLAVDSLDLLELALKIEEALDVSLPERLLSAVRTYGDLVALVLDRVRYPATVAAEPMLLRVRITPPPAQPRQAAVRVFVLTPYAVQLVTEEAKMAGPGTRVELTVPAGGGGPAVAHLHETFADLTARDIVVVVTQDERWKA
jgi:acyl carrier protein